MTGEGQVHPDLGVLPDELVGKAIKDREFREAVLGKADNKDELKRYLEGKGFKDLSDAALTFIGGLNPHKVNGVLRAIDVPTNQDFDGGNVPEILAS